MRQGEVGSEMYFVGQVGLCTQSVSRSCGDLALQQSAQF